jgi:hypothetical protein
MVRADLIKGLLRENGDTYKDYAKIIGRTVTTVQSRLKGETLFTWEEINKTRTHYNLSDERFMIIFFGK